MITAVVRYKLPPQIDYAACREHFHKIAPDFREVTGLISKHFIWTEHRAVARGHHPALRHEATDRFLRGLCGDRQHGRKS